MSRNAAPTPQELVEVGLAASTADACIVLVEVSASANLRWANNTLTTNGVMHGGDITAISFVGGAEGTASASVSRSGTTLDAVRDVVAAADAAAREADAAEDAAPLVEGDADAEWLDPPVSTSIGVFATFAPALGEAFGRAGAAGRVLYGYVEHTVDTVYLGSTTGLRRRHVQPTGHVGVTGKSADLTRSAWVGQATRDFGDVDALALDAELARRLGWAERSVDLPAGRYPTILPPAAVADLMIYAYWVADPSAYGVIEFDAQDRPIHIVEKPKEPRSNWAVTGLYFYDADVCDVAAQIPRSARGELEITDVNAHYLKQGRLTVEKLGRGYAWLDTGTPSSLLRAAQFVETVEDRQGLQIGSPEEVAWRKGYIDDAGLARLIEPIRDSEYGKYLQRLLARG